MRHPVGVRGHVRHQIPIYGYGWSVDGESRNTPEPSRFSCDNRTSLEGIVLGEHEFSDATVRRSPRHTMQDGIFNVEIRRDTKLLASGFAEAQPVGLSRR